MGCCHPSGLSVGLYLGSNNLHCWLVLGGHDWEALVPFYRAHSAEGPRWLVPGQAENPKARGGIAPAPSLSIPQSSLHPLKPLKLLSQPSSSRRRYLGMLIPLHHGSPAHLAPTAAHQPPPITNPICARRGRREKALHKELWGGKDLSALRELGKTLGACGRVQGNSPCTTLLHTPGRAVIPVVRQRLLLHAEGRGEEGVSSQTPAVARGVRENQRLSSP